MSLTVLVFNLSNTLFTFSKNKDVECALALANYPVDFANLMEIKIDLLKT